MVVLGSGNGGMGMGCSQMAKVKPVLEVRRIGRRGFEWSHANAEVWRRLAGGCENRRRSAFYAIVSDYIKEMDTPQGEHGKITDDD